MERGWYVITDNNQDYWSNRFGWVERIESATVFSADERRAFNLPLGEGVIWMPVSRYRRLRNERDA